MWLIRVWTKNWDKEQKSVQLIKIIWNIDPKQIELQERQLNG